VGLLLDGLGDLLVAMADADGENAAEEIEIFLAVDIVNVVVFGVIHHQRLVVISGHTGEEIFPMLVNDFLFVQ